MSEQIKKVPAVALRGMTILPGMIAHFDVSRERSIHAVEQAMMDDEQIFLVTQRNAEENEPEAEDLYQIGILASIKQVIKMQDNIVRVLVEGTTRAQLQELFSEGTYLAAEVMTFSDTEDLSGGAKEAMLRGVQETFTKYCMANPKMGKEFLKQIKEAEDLEKTMDQISNNLPVRFEEKQHILEAVTLTERYEVLVTLLLNEIQIMDLKNEFQKKVKAHVDQNQKEYLLREQMKVIREELGEENTESDADQFLEEVGRLKADEKTKEKIKKEISRFKNISSNSSESAVTRGYIETLLELPWNKVSRDNRSLKNAKKILDEDHYGLEKVKERMLEFLAVRNLTKKGESPIICLVGPPEIGRAHV